VGQQSSDLDSLQKIVAKKNLEATSQKANERQREIQTLVNEQVDRGHSYELAWGIVKKARPHLFSGMADPAPAQKAAHTPRKK
jgi:hypothetical protein